MFTSPAQLPPGQHRSADRGRPKPKQNGPGQRYAARSGSHLAGLSSCRRRAGPGPAGRRRRPPQARAATASTSHRDGGPRGPPPPGRVPLAGAVRAPAATWRDSATSPARGTTRRNPPPPAAFALSGVTVVLRPPIGAADTTPNAGLARNQTVGHPVVPRGCSGTSFKLARAAAYPQFNLRHSGCASARGLPTRPCIYIIASSSNTKSIPETERLDSGSMHEATCSARPLQGRQECVTVTTLFVTHRSPSSMLPAVCA